MEKTLHIQKLAASLPQILNITFIWCCTKFRLLKWSAWRTSLTPLPCNEFFKRKMAKQLFIKLQQHILIRSNLVCKNIGLESQLTHSCLLWSSFCIVMRSIIWCHFLNTQHWSAEHHIQKLCLFYQFFWKCLAIVSWLTENFMVRLLDALSRYKFLNR